MRIRSTKRKNIDVSLSDALLQGLASDGGLFVPKEFPQFQINEFIELDNLADIAFNFLQPFFDDDQLNKHLRSICENTFKFEIPLNFLNSNQAMLELFHGPTGAFKDVGAKFLAECLGKLGLELTILVATSGDTGSAVAAAFHKVPGINVYILYPKGMISEFQETQLTCWDTNITSIRVNGDFDICQAMVKEAFADDSLRKKFNLSSANSINLGRLLPQCVYYVSSSLEYYKTQNKAASFVIPTGNMGNALAAIWVKEMGFPIDNIILACNENQTIVDYINTRKLTPRPSIRTLANAMDVGNPSNLERFIDLESQMNHSFDYILARSVTDDEIKNTIHIIQEKYNKIICPHTATAFNCNLYYNLENSVVISTAHPAKFKDIMEAIIHKEVTLPPKLKEFIDLPKNYTDIEPNLAELIAVLKKNDLK